MNGNERKAPSRMSLREALRLSGLVIDAQRSLASACDVHAGVDIRIVSEPKNLDLEHRSFMVVDRTRDPERVLFGPVPCDNLDDLACSVQANCRRWVETHARRRAMKVVD